MPLKPRDLFLRIIWSGVLLLREWPKAIARRMILPVFVTRTLDVTLFFAMFLFFIDLDAVAFSEKSGLHRYFIRDLDHLEEFVQFFHAPFFILFLPPPEAQIDLNFAALV